MKLLRLVGTLTTILGIVATVAVLNVRLRAGEKPKVQKVTVLIKGVHCFQCVDDLRTSLEMIKGIRFDSNSVDTGEEPRFFTEPFMVKIEDPKKTILGAVARVVSETKTQHRKEFPPSLHLVLYSPDPITEEAVIDLREALKDVNGLELMVPGGSGGFPSKGYFWLQLEGAGGAVLNDVLEALDRGGIRVSLEKE